MNAPVNPFKPGSPPEGTSSASKSATPTHQYGPEMMAEYVQLKRLASQQNQELTDLKTRLGRRGHQLAILQHVSEILAATPKVAQVASVLLDLFVQELGAKACGIWLMDDGGSAYHPRAGYGVPKSVWSQMDLPAPNPFPASPIVLFQDQWLDPAMIQGTPLEALKVAPNLNLFFVPFDHQLLLMGFALLAIEQGRDMEEDQETLSVLQRQVAVSIYNAWLFRDLGEQRDTLRRQTAELETANEALREADRFKSEFLALTSHELRTPLTGILGFTRLVLDKLYEDEDEMRRMLEDSYTSGQHLLALLNDILDLAKIEAGRMQVKPEPWSLYILLEEVKPIVSAYPHPDTVQLEWPENLQEMPEILIDPGRFKQILLNLLSNALKFTKEGSVRVLVERGIGKITIQVVDTGIGVAPEAQVRLFQKFVQAEGSHARQYGGTGLGLVICKHLIEMMGGTIQLFSEGIGQGTTMTLTVDIA